ncbi:MAG: hypothetical protein CME64_13430 [Halobacteriovoraceae bacterium]|nr:hypothetical protein [Halobacteriovoraceae bacterium]
MRSYLVLICILNLSTAVFAVDLETYCKEAFKQRSQSKEAVLNGGFYKERKSYETSRIKYNKRRYLGCRFDTPWMSDLYNQLCTEGMVNESYDVNNLNNIKLPELILFFFDGMSDFNASLGKENLKAVNLDGSEGNDLGVGNANGQKALNQSLETLSKNVPRLMEKVEIHYHPGSGLHRRENYDSAMACAAHSKDAIEVLEAITGKERHIKWSSIGFSNGGYLATEFQNEVTKSGIEIDLAFSIDPVVQTLYYPFKMSDEFVGQRNGKTKRFINYFQDSHILPNSPIQIHRGRPVENADRNINLSSAEYADLLDSPYDDHVQMPESEIVRNALTCELSDLLNLSVCK